MGRPRKDAFDEATVSRVIHAAEQVFGARGYRAARLEDIAKLAHIRRPSLLYHFGSKANLYQRVVGGALEELRAAVQGGLVTEGDFPQRLAATVDALLTFEESRRPLVGLIVREMLDNEGLAREVVASKLTPLVDDLEMFLTAGGANILPPNLPIRSAIMHLMMGHLSRAAMDELGSALFGEGDHIRTLTQRMFLGDQPRSDDEAAQ